jgi:branched-chain amino acid transport system substrate-binding protein
LVSTGVGANKKPITVGMVVALSGAVAGGEAPLVNGVKMAVAEINSAGGINGRSLNVVFEDTGSEQTGGVNAYNRILSRHPVAIMDTTVSGFVLSQMPSIKAAGIPTFTGGASIQLSRANQGAENLYRVRTSDARVPRAAVRFALNDLKATKIGVIYVNNQYGNGWKDAINETLASRKLKAAGVESYSPTDSDLTPQLLHLKNDGAQVVIFVGDPPNQVLGMLQAKQLNVPYKLITSNAGMLPTTLKLIPTEASEGVFGTVDSLPSVNSRSKGWATRYKATFNISADYSAAEYYDAVQMLARSLRAKGTDSVALNKSLRNIRVYRGMGNVYSFAGQGDGGAGVAIAKVVSGQPTLAKEMV